MTAYQFAFPILIQKMRFFVIFKNYFGIFKNFLLKKGKIFWVLKNTKKRKISKLFQSRKNGKKCKPFMVTKLENEKYFSQHKIFFQNFQIFSKKFLAEKTEVNKVALLAYYGLKQYCLLFL